MDTNTQQAALSIAEHRILEAVGQGLDELSLAGLGLTALPDSLCDRLVGMQGLRSLDLSNNQLTALPEAIGQLTHLQVLSLGHNPLMELPDSMGALTALKVLDIVGTGVVVLPEGLARLVEVRSLTVINDDVDGRPINMSGPVEVTRSGGERSSKGIWDMVEEEEEEFETMRGGEPSRSQASIPQDVKAQLGALPAADATTATRSITKDWTNISVFSPRQVVRDDTFLVQVFAYLPDQLESVQETAVMVDDTAEQVAKKKLGMPVERDTDLTFELVMSGLEIGESVQSLRWQGWEDSVTFDVTVPADVTKKTIVGKVTVSQSSVPLGRLTFKVTVGAVSDESTLAGEEAKRYEKAFVSYSSKDRKEVLKRVQGLKSTGIEVFQDVLDLEPGERWEKSLYKNIDECDLFLLCWSTAAKASKWVLKEAEYALDLQEKDEFHRPDIKPVILEGPPIVPPPEGLQNLHFNDKIIYLINQS